MRMLNIKLSKPPKVIDKINQNVDTLPLIKIKVVGVGGGGCNAIDRMIQYGLGGVEFWSINTDRQTLDLNLSQNKIQIGSSLTKGLGAGGEISVGEKAAIEKQSQIENAIKDADLLFLTAGLGGGTGTGAISVIAESARKLGILTVAIVTEPFNFEGKRRAAQAKLGLDKLAKFVDSLIVVSNDALVGITTQKTTLAEAFKISNEVLLRGVQGISDILTSPGVINIDFADIKNILKESGNAILGIGIGEGANGSIEAANLAIGSKLLKTPLRNAKRLIVNVCGNSQLSLGNVIDAMDTVNKFINPNANIIMGTSVDESLSNQAIVTIIASGLDEQE